MIKNVIFDLGDVLINNNPLRYIKTLGYSDEKTNALYQALSTDSVWHDKDIGIYASYIDCIPIFQKHHPELTKEIADFFKIHGWKKYILLLKKIWFFIIEQKSWNMIYIF